MLTKREVDFCKAFIKSRGKKNYIDYIAKIMKIKKRTALTHKINIYAKLLVETQTELMHYLLTRTDWYLTKYDQ